MDIDYEILEKLHEEIPVPKGCKEPLKDNSRGKLYSVMNHKDCALARGVKHFKCTRCGRDGNNYFNGIDVCNDCCKKYNICKICGKPLKPMIVHNPETEHKDPSIIDVIPLEYIEMFFVDDKGLQKMLSNKELFKQYELTICWTTGDKGDLWRIKPKKIC